MNQILKKLICGVTAFTLLTASVPFAAQAASSTPEISTWSISTLIDGEKFGIYPQSWYYDNFTKATTKAKAEQLVKAYAEKLKALNLPKDSSFKKLAVANVTTRGGFLTALYNEAAAYKWPGTFMAQKKDMVSFFKTLGILSGTEKDMALKRIMTTEEGAVFTTKLVKACYYANSSGAEGLVWKATKGTTTVYMLGSVHVGDPMLYPMDQYLMKAFDGSSALLVEANLFDTKGVTYMQEKSYLPSGRTLDKVVSPETYALVKQAFTKVGVSEDVFKTLKPWSAANTLSVMATQGSSAEEAQTAQEAASLGVDLFFTTKALYTHKPVIELEGLKFQADLFDNMDAKLQEDNLKAAANEILKADGSNATQSEALLNEWLKEWVSGDKANFQKSFGAAVSSSDTGFTKALLTDRDSNMTQKIAALLDQNDGKTYFVVVGAGHLALENSVPVQLKALGYAVESVDFDGPNQ